MIKAEISFTLHCHDLPTTCGGITTLRFGPQRDKDVVDDVPTTLGETTFTFPLSIQISPETSEIDFSGPFVHGKRGERFLYLSWGDRNTDGKWVIVSRSKIPLGRLDRAAVLAAIHQGRPLGFSARLSNAKGALLTGTLPVDAMICLPPGT